MVVGGYALAFMVNLGTLVILISGLIVLKKMLKD